MAATITVGAPAPAAKTLVTGSLRQVLIGILLGRPSVACYA